MFFFSNSLICVIIRFLTKLLTLGILFSTALRALIVARLAILGISPLTSFILELRVVSVAKSVILDISPLTSFILALRAALVATLVISDILSSIFIILALYTSFLKTSFFTAWLSLHKSTGTGTYLSTSNLSTLLFKLLKIIRTVFSLSICTLNSLIDVLPAY